MAGYLQAIQMGFRTAQGCEATIHATRAFAHANEGRQVVILRIDINNAVNSKEGTITLSLLHQYYSAASNLLFGDEIINLTSSSSAGRSFGALAIQKVISSLDSPLNLWFLDDGTVVGC